MWFPRPASSEAQIHSFDEAKINLSPQPRFGNTGFDATFFTNLIRKSIIEFSALFAHAAEAREHEGCEGSMFDV